MEKKETVVFFSFCLEQKQILKYFKKKKTKLKYWSQRFCRFRQCWFEEQRILMFYLSRHVFLILHHSCRSRNRNLQVGSFISWTCSLLFNIGSIKAWLLYLWHHPRVSEEPLWSSEWWLWQLPSCQSCLCCVRANLKMVKDVARGWSSNKPPVKNSPFPNIHIKMSNIAKYPVTITVWLSLN